MKSGFQGLRARAAGAATGMLTAFWGVSAFAQDRIGEPTNWAMDMQPGVTPLRDQAIFFHNVILMPIITVITLLVLGLLAWCVIRYNKRSNPVPARWSHNTPIEIIWTVFPVMILMVIAIFSFRLLFDYHDMPTVRRIVRQAATDDYRFRSIVLGVIASDAFRTREGERAPVTTASIR